MKTTFQEVTFGSTETMAHVYSDGTLGDVYRFADDVEELASYAPNPAKYLLDWPVGRNPLFRHYVGPNRSGFLRSALAELKRNPNTYAVKTSTKLRLVIIPRHHAEWLGMLPASLGGWVHTGDEWYNGADSLTRALGRNGYLAALPASLAVDECESPADALALAAGLERDADTCAKIRCAGVWEWAAPMCAFAARLRAL